ncbi:hypothetical protein BDV98DRAFT_565930 [Pterulicium gracile]|uniref:C3H1-type domain-containing protein n=1 Tax=Pterulicium gracile TaxID=1884261 RepID=A0A5C3QVZ3_9AGAR|nr:hypothetical protein BDV98DRAFT_565930 [Pterula gracilis]
MILGSHLSARAFVLHLRTTAFPTVTNNLLDSETCPVWGRGWGTCPNPSQCPFLHNPKLSVKGDHKHKIRSTPQTPQPLASKVGPLQVSSGGACYEHPDTQFGSSHLLHPPPSRVNLLLVQDVVSEKRANAYYQDYEGPQSMNNSVYAVPATGAFYPTSDYNASPRNYRDRSGRRPNDAHQHSRR